MKDRLIMGRSSWNSKLLDVDMLDDFDDEIEELDEID